MYARLKDEYLLRGWEGLPYGVVEKKFGGAVFFDAEVFFVFNYLDGQSDLDLVFLSGAQEEALAGLRKEGALETSPAPFPAKEAPMADYRRFPCHCVTAIHWSITGACNLRCRHCYISAPHYKYHDLDTADCLALIGQMAEAGVVSVSISGGEPLLRKDFWTLMDALRAKDIAIPSIFTNGLLVDDAFLDECDARRFFPGFLVSFDGLGCHDWLRGIDGSEEKTIAALRRLIGRGHRVTVNTALYAGSLDALLPTYEFLKGLGISAWRPGPITDNGEWIATTAGRDAPAPLPRNILWERYEELARRCVADGQPFDLQLGPCFKAEAGPEGKRFIPAARFPGTEEELRQFSCRVCRTHPTLMPDGLLLPCPGMTSMEQEGKMPNLLQTPLAEVYSQPEGAFFALANLKAADVVAANALCRDCPWRLECGGGCRAASMTVGCGALGRDEDTCAFFREGWRDRFAALL